MKTINIEDILSHYNIIGLSIGIGLGTAGQQFLFSLVNNMIVPATGRLFGKSTEFKIDNFVSHLITFILVVLIILFSLKTVLSVIVNREVTEKKQKDERDFEQLQEIIQKQHQINQKLDKMDDKSN